MVSTKTLGSVFSTGKRLRKRYDPARRREVAKTRELGACTECRRRKVRCLHAQKPFKEGGIVLPESLSLASLPHPDTVAYPTLQNRAVRDSGPGTHGDRRGRIPPLDSQLWDDGIMPFYDVESYASQNPMVATTNKFPVATSSPLATPSNMGNTLQHTNEISSQYITQATHETSYLDTCSYPSMCHLVESLEEWGMAPTLYPYSSQMSSSLHPPPVLGLSSSETDHEHVNSLDSYPQDGGQISVGYDAIRLRCSARLSIST